MEVQDVSQMMDQLVPGAELEEEQVQYLHGPVPQEERRQQRRDRDKEKEEEEERERRRRNNREDERRNQKLLIINYNTARYPGL